MYGDWDWPNGLTPCHEGGGIRCVLYHDHAPYRSGDPAVALFQETQQRERADGEEVAREGCDVEPFRAELSVHPGEREDLEDTADNAGDPLDNADGERAEAEAPLGDRAGVHEWE